ncbi:hypothetical protein G7068_11810 [Leucobacter viscericola]|uniref:Replication protein n=1 Tax=Leucobacter viscericola TaxID=2714935 RepID=A0A6G7XGR3_9MICO|nr:hypothetical protein [Leucobacter viscericola]QIK63794.1 hypothetical protein G7068_11810 [Leucobacter viscericola]
MNNLDPGVASALSLYLRPDKDHANVTSGAVAARAERKRGDCTAASEASVAAPAALDSTLSYCWGQIPNDENETDFPDSSGERRAIRWAARALLWKASTLRPVRMCGRVLRDDPGAPSTGAGVKRRELPNGAVAGYSGVTLCGSVWSCPRCSAVIAQRRAEEISRAVAACHQRGGKVYLMTKTVRHTRKDSLEELFNVISKGWRSGLGGVAWSGRKERVRVRDGREWLEPAILGDAERFGIAGRVRATEATVSLPGSGGHGWHVHFHALIFATGTLGEGLRIDLDSHLNRLFGTSISWDRDGLGLLAFGSQVFGRYRKAIEKVGFRADSEGFDLREVHDGGADFVGSYLAKATYDVAARIGFEVASGAHTKNSRVERNVTPFEVLSRCAEDLQARRFGIRTPRRWEIINLDDGTIGLVNLDTGSVDSITSPGLWALWHEWERASRGRHQIHWSLKLKNDSERAQLWEAIVSARGETKDDETVAQVELQGERLGEIPREDWYGHLVWRPAWLVGALDAAEQRGFDGLRTYLESRKVRLTFDQEFPS